MKKITYFESSIIGLLVGVVVATYVVFLNGVSGFVGETLGWTSLLPIISGVSLSDSLKLIVTFLFVVLVYIVYALVICFLVRKVGLVVKIFLGVAALVLLVTGGVEQINGAKLMAVVPSSDLSASVFFKAPVKTPEQYFGQEATGDLNGDGKDDVAFIIPRDDAGKTMYYLSAALKSDTGHAGTNLVYIGSKIDPKGLSISNGVIDLEYTDRGSKQATSTKQMQINFVDGKLILATLTATSSL